MVIIRRLEILSFQKIKQDVAAFPLVKRWVSISKDFCGSWRKMYGFTRGILEYDLSF